MKGVLEKRVFATFFVVSFTTLLLLTLAAWQVVRYGIHLNEEEELKVILQQISGEYSEYLSSRTKLLEAYIDVLDTSSQPPKQGALHHLISPPLLTAISTGFFFNMIGGAIC